MTQKTCTNFKHVAFHDGSLEGFSFKNGELSVTISDVYLYPTKDEEISLEKGEIIFTGIYSISLNGFDGEMGMLKSDEEFSFDIDTVEEAIISPERKKYTFKLLPSTPSSESIFGYAELVIEAKNFILYY